VGDRPSTAGRSVPAAEEDESDLHGALNWRLTAARVEQELVGYLEV
jgi:hypothetical protein